MFETIMFLLAGMGAFLVGFKVLSENIGKLANNAMRKMFAKISGNRIAGVAVGAGATALLQSSAATTVMLIGFVNAGLITLYQAVPIIMGANIGTTVTAIILSLDALDVPLIAMSLAFFGIFASMIVRKERLKTLFLAIAGIGLVFFGLKVMSKEMTVVAEQPFVQGALSAVTFPILLLLLGAVFTIIMQSSTAVTGILLSMAGSGLVIGGGGNSIYFVILGTNVGTCLTAIISSIGARTNAKRTAMIHLLFNVVGSIIFLVVLWVWTGFNDFWSSLIVSPKMEIALFHMSFNLITTILFLPMTDLIVKLTKRLVPAKKAKKRNSLVALDDRLLRTPGVAVGAVLLATKDMGEVSFKALKTAFDAFIDKDKERKSEVAEYAAQSGEINVDITSYLVKISSQSIGYNSEKIVSAVHTSITDIERLAELADNVTRYTEHYIEQELEFSEQVLTELKEMFKKIEELFHASMRSLDLEKDYDVKIAEGLEDEIDGYKKRLLDGHMKRLNEGICRPESSGVFINLVNNLERAGDHLMFIASAFNDAKDSSGR